MGWVWPEVVSLRLLPMEGLAKQSEALKQFSSIGIKAAWTLLLQMPEANRFSLLRGHIPVMSGLTGQKNSKVWNLQEEPSQ